MTTRIVAASRLHAGLLDLGNATPRRYGGVGFMINRPGVTVTVSRSRSWDFTTQVPLDMRARHQMLGLLQRVARLTRRAAARVQVNSIGPQHVGLGTKTGLMLAALVALNRELDLGWGRTAIQEISGRGGTSGIGIHGFFLGGLIADAGHRNSIDMGFAPSGSTRRTELPLLIQRVSIPSDWRFMLLLPPGRLHSGEDEALFFRNNTPLPRRDVLEAIAITYHGIIPAVTARDLRQLRQALVSMHSLGFKARELRTQPSNVRALYRTLLAIPGVAVGMSSMGPLIYAVSRVNDIPSLSALRQIASDRDVNCLGLVRCANRGFRFQQ
jgi:beta-ribofuranosylaminobenzene 5'-phosphate synthase